MARWPDGVLAVATTAGEPVIVRSGDRLLVFIRGRGPANTRQFISVSDDWGQTWKTELSNIEPVNEHTRGLAHPFAMVDPHDPDRLLAITFERPMPGSAQLWRGRKGCIGFMVTSVRHKPVHHNQYMKLYSLLQA